LLQLPERRRPRLGRRLRAPRRRLRRAQPGLRGDRLSERRRRFEEPRARARPGASGAPVTLSEGIELVLDTPVDLEAVAREAGALAIGPLARNADLGDALLSWRRLDQGDLRGERATVLVQGHEQIGLERDEEVRALLVDGAGAQHAERMRRQGQRVAL